MSRTFPWITETAMSSASGAEKTLNEVLAQAERLMMAIIILHKGGANPAWLDKNRSGIAFMEREIHNRASKKAITSKEVTRGLNELAQLRENLKEFLKPESTNGSSVADGSGTASFGTTSENP